MKRLWKVIPPCISDLIGFEAVMNETEGLGIIDDSSTYKPVRFGRGGQGRPERGREMEQGFQGKGADEMRHGKPWNMERSSRDFESDQSGDHGSDGRSLEEYRSETLDPNGRGSWDRDPDDRVQWRHGSESRGPWGQGQNDHGHGGRGGGRGLAQGMRVLNSDIRNEDIITGTESKVLGAYERGAGQLSPDFVLLAYGPSASMIGSDLEYAAEKISGMGGLPAASVKIDGEKDYLYGIGCTLEALGRLLLAPRQTIPGTVNLLGGNTIDWAKETIADVENMLMQDGWQILSRWGTKETTEHLKMASAAAVNLVVNESGLRLARYMESEFGIPFIADAPFGTANTLMLRKKLGASISAKKEEMTPVTEREAFMVDFGAESDISKTQTEETTPEILIVGEQFTANAIRQELLRRGQKAIRVLSFYDMDRAYMLPGDKKLVSEDDFAAQANAASVRVILADPDCQPLVKKEVQWISIPNGGSMFPIEPMEPFNMVGSALDAWLDQRL